MANADIAKIQKRAEVIERKAYVDGAMDIDKAEAFVDLNKKIDSQTKEITTFNTQRQDY